MSSKEAKKFPNGTMVRVSCPGHSLGNVKGIAQGTYEETTRVYFPTHGFLWIKNEDLVSVVPEVHYPQFGDWVSPRTGLNLDWKTGIVVCESPMGFGYWLIILPDGGTRREYACDFELRYRRES